MLTMLLRGSASLGYAFLMNLPGFGSVEFGDNQTSWQLDTVLQADFWVATTDPPVQGAEVSPWAQLQHSYANATGHSPVYPQWTSGYWQCKNRYHNQTQVNHVYTLFTRQNVATLNPG